MPGQPKPQSKTCKKTVQPPRDNAWANTKAHLPPVEVVADSGDDSSNDGDGKDSDNNWSNGDLNEGAMSDSNGENASNIEEDQLDSDYASNVEQDDITNAGLDASAVHATFEEEVQIVGPPKYYSYFTVSLGCKLERGYRLHHHRRSG